MKKIIGLGVAVAVVIALVTTGTFALFSDTETSSPNTFTAGIIDLEVDAEDEGGVIFTAQDDPLPEIFRELYTGDIKPGDSGEVTISLHLKADSNDADLWMQILNLTPDGGILSEPECKAEGGTWNNTTKECLDATSVDDDICAEIEVLLWLDMDDTSPAVPGDNIYQDGETILYGSVAAGGETLNDLFNLQDPLTVKDGAVACTIYYVGWSWELSDVGNEHQGDKCTFDVKFGADQITP